MHEASIRSKKPLQLMHFTVAGSGKASLELLPRGSGTFAVVRYLCAVLFRLPMQLG